MVMRIIFIMGDRMTSSCKKTTLSSHGSFSVERCSCGTIHLHIGALTLRIEGRSLDQLALTLGEASSINHHLERQIEVLGFQSGQKSTENKEHNQFSFDRVPQNIDEDFH